ncbi:transglycosylase SLT domain-containing protein [Sulfuriflexus mobilis]|uniref:transglycosylase SLT domain-containing protein n=1 Tax=Sulfuriflexus mobilis TaxID=1811807 RepID=UPI0018D57B7C|nr:transglycosylase SLT domain-containing protein [Sulfuriflexus mobilis]
MRRRYSSPRSGSRSTAIVFIALMLGMLLMAVVGSALAEGSIPANAKRYQRTLMREAQAHWGLNAPVARFAAQIHQESGWRITAKSRYADGLAQFTPSTAEWIAEIYPAHLANAAPYSPQWAIKALVIYDKYLFDHIQPQHAGLMDECDRWAMALSAYNGGLGWVNRDRRLTTANGDDPDRWFGNVENHTQRADWARDENRRYPQRILCILEPRYLRQHWFGEPEC